MDAPPNSISRVRLLLVTISAGLALAAVGLLGQAVAGRALNKSAQPEAKPSDGQYNYGNPSGELSVSADHVPSTRELLTRAEAQWPEEPQARAHKLMERIDRVSEAVNRLLGDHVVATLGETGRTGLAAGKGMVTLDASVVWRLSEDALACLMAHEFAHEHLNHVAELNRLRTETSVFQNAQRERDLESAADEMAGRVIAQTAYRSEGFQELLMLAHDTAWHNPLLRSYYSHDQRIEVFQRGYRMTREMAHTTR